MTLPAPLWFDAPDAAEQVAARRATGEITSAEEIALLAFIRDGYAVLPESIDAALTDEIIADIQQAPLHREQIVLRKNGEYSHPGALGVVGRRKRIIDFHAFSHSALQVALAAPITRFLSLLYGEPPLAFQSLLFQYGSRQAMHRDPYYVATGHPPALTATWVALEDIVAGSGELAYYPSSHRITDTSFASGKSTWAKHTDDKDSHVSHLDRLIATCEAAGLRQSTFIAKKGQILVWHANLVHGGSTVLEPDQTRRSFVTHYCPMSDYPAYLKNSPTSERYAFGEGFYASRHYDIPRRAVNQQTLAKLWATNNSSAVNLNNPS